LVEESLPDEISLVVLVEPRPTQDRVPHHLIDPSVLERSPHEPRRIPAKSPQRRVDVNQPEAEATVDNRGRLRGVHPAERFTDVLSRLSDPLLRHHADAMRPTRLAEVPDIRLADE
jgi:hypothetical protein